MRIIVLGSGRAAAALGPRWAAAGHEVVVRSRRDGPLDQAPSGDVIILAVPDGALADVALALASRASAPNEVWLHLSGVHPAAVLRVADRPRAVGCLHPLVALAAGGDPRAPLGDPTPMAGLEGEAEALTIAEPLARAAGLAPHTIPADPHGRALSPAAAVSVAGHATALFAQAMELLGAIGFAPEEARDALLPLFRSAAANLGRGLPPEVITGPATRGDAATIARHLEALGRGDVAITYRALARTALALSSARLSPEVAAGVRALVGPSSGSLEGS